MMQRLDPKIKAELAVRAQEEIPNHGVRCPNCTLHLEHCKCETKFPRLRSRTKYKVLPPRGVTKPYSFFFNETNSKVRADHPTASPSEIAQLLSQKWMQLQPRQKVKYQELSKNDKIRFEKERIERLNTVAELQISRKEFNTLGGGIIKIINDVGKRPSTAPQKNEAGNTAFVSQPRTRCPPTSSIISSENSLNQTSAHSSMMDCSAQLYSSRTSFYSAPSLSVSSSRSRQKNIFNHPRKHSPNMMLPALNIITSPSLSSSSLCCNYDSVKGLLSGIDDKAEKNIENNIDKITIGIDDANASPETLMLTSSLTSRVPCSGKLQRKVSLPRLGVERIIHHTKVLNSRGQIELQSEERSVLVEISAPHINPLDLQIFKSCHADDERPLMPSMRSAYGNARYNEPLAPRTEKSYREILFIEKQREQQRKQIQTAKKKVKCVPKREQQVIHYRGQIKRKIKIGQFMRRVSGETLIFTVYQVGMDGRVYKNIIVGVHKTEKQVATTTMSNMDKTAGGEVSDYNEETKNTSHVKKVVDIRTEDDNKTDKGGDPLDGTGPRFFEVNAYNPLTSRTYTLRVDVPEIIQKYGYEALKLLVPGRKQIVIQKILDNLFFKDPDVPSLKRLCLAGTVEGYVQSTTFHYPSLLSIVSPRSKRREKRIARRMRAKRNRSKIVMVARIIHAQVFQVSVYHIASYGRCFNLVCYHPATSVDYPLVIPWSDLPYLLPHFPLAHEHYTKWDMTSKIDICTELARRVSIRRFDTKFDGCCSAAIIGPGGRRRGMLAPELPEAQLFRSNIRAHAQMGISRMYGGFKPLRELLQGGLMSGAGLKVAAGATHFGRTRRMCFFTLFKEQPIQRFGTVSTRMRLALYFPDNSSSYAVSFAHTDFAMFFKDRTDLLPIIPAALPETNGEQYAPLLLDKDAYTRYAAGAAALIKNKLALVPVDYTHGVATANLPSRNHSSSGNIINLHNNNNNNNNNNDNGIQNSAIKRSSGVFKAAGEKTKYALSLNRVVYNKPYYLEIKDPPKTDMRGGSMFVSIFGDMSDDESDDDNSDSIDLNDNSDDDSFERAFKEKERKKRAAYALVESEDEEESKKEDEDEEAELASDSDDDTEEREWKRKKRSEQAERERQKEKHKPSVTAVLEKAKKEKPAEKKRRLMLVQVEQHGIQFVFRAFDLSPQRKYGPVEYKWEDKLSAALSVNLVEADPQKRDLLIEVNVGSLYLIPTTDKEEADAIRALTADPNDLKSGEGGGGDYDENTSQTIDDPYASDEPEDESQTLKESETENEEEDRNEKNPEKVILKENVKESGADVGDTGTNVGSMSQKVEQESNMLLDDTTRRLRLRFLGSLRGM